MLKLQELIQKNFFPIQILLGLGFTLAWMYLFPRANRTQFKVRESDRLSPTQKPQGARLEDSRIQPQAPYTPPLLAGIRIQGLPHEILGVEPHATVKEIQTAYYELMKAYHPDRIGKPGSREWKDAQLIASAINDAKEKMIKQRKAG